MKRILIRLVAAAVVLFSLGSVSGCGSGTEAVDTSSFSEVHLRIEGMT